MIGGRLGLTLLLGISVTAACQGKPVPVSEVSVSDSAGMTLVDVGPLEGVAAPEWATEERFTTAREGVELFRVSAARILPDGRVLVGNGGNSEILVLDAGGAVRNRIGREGDGPGEFRRMVAIHPTDDGFAVYDAGNARWSHFDQGGELLATEPMHPPTRIVSLEPLGIGDDGQILAVFGAMRFFQSEGIHRDTTPLLHYESMSHPPDTLGLWAGTEWSYSAMELGGARTPVGFGRGLAFGGRDSLAALGDTDTLDISVWDVGGSERLRIRGGGARIHATAEEGERWRRKMLARFGSSMPEQMREVYREAPVHDSYPAFDGVAMDTEGRVWVGATAELGEELRRWVVFAADGSPVGRVDLPANGELLDVTSDQVLLLRRDDLGVESVVLYGLVPDP